MYDHIALRNAEGYIYAKSKEHSSFLCYAQQEIG